MAHRLLCVPTFDTTLNGDSAQVLALSKIYQLYVQFDPGLRAKHGQNVITWQNALKIIPQCAVYKSKLAHESQPNYRHSLSLPDLVRLIAQHMPADEQTELDFNKPWSLMP